MTSVTPGKPAIKTDNKTFGEVTGVIGLMGENVVGNMIVSFDGPSILSIVSRMLGETFTEINKDVVDAVGEITNMICGGAKTEFAEMGLGIGMASPMMVTGKDIELSQLAKALTISMPFDTPEGRFVIEANLHVK